MSMNTMVPAARAASAAAASGETRDLDFDARAVASAEDNNRGAEVRTPEMERFWFFSVTRWFSDLNKRNAATVLVLCYCNLINYMDRSTVAGMIDYIRSDPSFAIQKNDSTIGLLQTVFVVLYMATAPVFGVLGDRVNRKWLVGAGLTFWSGSTLLGSFCTDFWWFLAFRALVGVGEASYSTVAPAIISDLFVGDVRSRVLALFYFAIPFGTGLGYIVGAEVASHAGDWRWGLRVTPFMGLVAVCLVAFVMVDPPRGGSEGARMRSDSTKDDLKSFLRNKTFCLSTIAFTFVTFCTGALAWWGPSFTFYGAKAACGNNAGCENITQANVSYKFGIVMTFAGLLGVPLGSYVAQFLRHRFPNADPLVCGTSLILSVPVMYFGLVLARYNVSWTYALTFFAGLLLNCNWAIVSDMTLYIVIPIRRSLASATQILVSHAFGDAASPYLIGAIADGVKKAINSTTPPPLPDAFNGTVFVEDLRVPIESHTPRWFDIEFRGLQYALFLCCFCQAIGGFVFLVMSWYVVEDRRRATDEARAYSDIDSLSAAVSRNEHHNGSEEEEGEEVADNERQFAVRNAYADERQGEEGVTERST